jgi:hypothetical protein
VSSSDPEHDGGPDAEHPSTPKPDPLDVDSAFAAIIAGWADSPTTGSWPSQEDLSVGRHRRMDEPDDDTGPGRDDILDADALTSVGGPLIPSMATPDVDEPDDADAFVPPDPPPLPRGDVISRLAWAAVLGGPAFLLVVVLAWRHAPQPLILTALVAFVGGFITLVYRMPKHRDDDDDGAVV